MDDHNDNEKNPLCGQNDVEEVKPVVLVETVDSEDFFSEDDINSDNSDNNNKRNSNRRSSTYLKNEEPSLPVVNDLEEANSNNNDSRSSSSRSSLLRNEVPPDDEGVDDPLSRQLEPPEEQQQAPALLLDTSHRVRRLRWQEEKEPMDGRVKCGIAVLVAAVALLALISGLVFGLSNNDDISDITLLSKILLEPTIDSRGHIIDISNSSRANNYTNYDDLISEPTVQYMVAEDEITKQFLNQVRNTRRESTKRQLKIQIRERYALTMLYKSTTNNESSWIDRNLWLNSTIHQCEWNGPPLAIKGFHWCHREDYNNRTYRELILSSNNLVGTVPMELFYYVRGLEAVDLSNNTLSGRFNDLIRYMPSGSTTVKHLLLNNNRLEGNMDELPIDHTTFLYSLYLQHNQLTGRIHYGLGDMPYLNNLALSFNKLTGQIPSSLGSFSLSSLEDLLLDNNYLTGTLPTTLAWRATALRHLWLHNNQFTGRVPSEFGDLGGHKSLKTLTLANNHLTGSIPTELYKLKVLELDLSNNQLTGRIETHLGQMQRLKVLRLANNSLEGGIPYDVIGKLKNLEAFDISGNPKLTGSIPSSLCFKLLNFDCNNDNNEICGCNCTCSSSDDGSISNYAATTAPSETKTSIDDTDDELDDVTESSAFSSNDTAATFAPTTTNNISGDDVISTTTDPCMVMESFEMADIALTSPERNASILDFLDTVHLLEAWQVRFLHQLKQN